MRSAGSFDTSLVERARSGSEEALEELLTRAEPMLRAFFVARVGRRPEVDDLIQNTLLRLHRGIADLQDASSLKAFAMKAALFELQDLYRGRYSAKEHLYDPERPPDQVDGGRDEGQRFDVEQALGTLTPKGRKIIELREFGYRYEEIAAMLGTTEAAVKMQVKRAFQRMRDYLRDDA